MCQEGFIISKHMFDALEDHLLKDVNFKYAFFCDISVLFILLPLIIIESIYKIRVILQLDILSAGICFTTN